MIIYYEAKNRKHVEECLKFTDNIFDTWHIVPKFVICDNLSDDEDFAIEFKNYSSYDVYVGHSAMNKMQSFILGYLSGLGLDIFNEEDET